MIHQLTFHGILNGFDVGGLGSEAIFQFPLHIVGNSGSIGSIALPGSFQCPQDGRSDLVLVI